VFRQYLVIRLQIFTNLLQCNFMSTVYLATNNTSTNTYHVYQKLFFFSLNVHSANSGTLFTKCLFTSLCLLISPSIMFYTILLFLFFFSHTYLVFLSIAGLILPYLTPNILSIYIFLLLFLFIF